MVMVMVFVFEVEISFNLNIGLDLGGFNRGNFLIDNNWGDVGDWLLSLLHHGGGDLLWCLGLNNGDGCNDNVLVVWKLNEELDFAVAA